MPDELEAFKSELHEAVKVHYKLCKRFAGDADADKSMQWLRLNWPAMVRSFEKEENQ